MKNSPDSTFNLKQAMTNDNFEVKSAEKPTQDKPTEGELMQGTVKWFNDAKGFGFIEHVSGRDVFVHYSVIETEGFKTLKDGEIVQYSLAEGDKGLHAARVIRDPAVVKSSMKAKAAQEADGLPDIEVERLSAIEQSRAEQAAASHSATELNVHTSTPKHSD